MQNLAKVHNNTFGETHEWTCIIVGLGGGHAAEAGLLLGWCGWGVGPLRTSVLLHKSMIDVLPKQKAPIEILLMNKHGVSKAGEDTTLVTPFHHA